jgi:hypothetical protein
MVKVKRPPPSVRLIVRRGAVDRYDKLKKKTAGLPVEVTWDRRKKDRRKSSGATENDRRKSDRRQKPPFTWDLSDFVVVEKKPRTRKS